MISTKRAASGALAALLSLMSAIGPEVASADAQPGSTVLVGDTTYEPWAVTVPVGGSVTWTNYGTQVHTATTPGANTAASFDTGGLAPGESRTIAFTAPGTYTYSSATDCLNGNANHSFNCDGPYTVTVVGSPGQPLALAVAPPPNPAPETVTVYVGDGDGFQPNTLTISAGQTITFVNRGQNTHSAVSDRGVLPAWDSGGIGAGESRSITFSTPGVYPFHSSTEPIWGRDAFGQTAVLGYVWNGLITVR